MRLEKVRLLGLGAVGAPIAVALEGIGDFAILLDEGRVRRYEEDGCTVNGVRHDFAIDRTDTPADLVIIACKNNDLAEALDTIAPHVGEETAIMSLLNGIESEEVLASRFGWGHMVHSFITGLSSVREGRSIDCFSPGGGIVVFNERGGGRSGRIDAIAQLFDRAGIRYEIPEDIIHEMWWKFAFNVCINTLSAIMDLDYSQMNGNADFQRLVRMMAKEIAPVARAEGVAFTASDEEKFFRILAQLDGNGRTSMLQDIDAGRETENRFLAQSLTALARRHGIATPCCDFAAAMVEARSHARKAE